MLRNIKKLLDELESLDQTSEQYKSKQKVLAFFISNQRENLVLAHFYKNLAQNTANQSAVENAIKVRYAALNSDVDTILKEKAFEIDRVQAFFTDDLGLTEAQLAAIPTNNQISIEAVFWQSINQTVKNLNDAYGNFSAALKQKDIDLYLLFSKHLPARIYNDILYSVCEELNTQLQADTADNYLNMLSQESSAKLKALSSGSSEFSEAFALQLYQMNQNPQQVEKDLKRFLKNINVDGQSIENTPFNSTDQFLKAIFPDVDPALRSYFKQHASQGDGFLNIGADFYSLKTLPKKGVAIENTQSPRQFKFYVKNSREVIFVELIDIKQLNNATADTSKGEKVDIIRDRALNELRESLGAKTDLDSICTLMTVSKIYLDSNNQVQHQLLEHKNFVLSQTHGKPLFEKNEHRIICDDQNLIKQGIKNRINLYVHDKQPSKLKNFWLVNKKLIIAGLIALAAGAIVATLIALPPLGIGATIAGIIAAKIGLTIPTLGLAAGIGGGLALSFPIGAALVAATTAIKSGLSKLFGLNKEPEKEATQPDEAPKIATGNATLYSKLGASTDGSSKEVDMDYLTESESSESSLSSSPVVTRNGKDILFEESEKSPRPGMHS